MQNLVTQVTWHPELVHLWVSHGLLTGEVMVWSQAVHAGFVIRQNGRGTSLALSTLVFPLISFHLGWKIIITNITEITHTTLAVHVVQSYTKGSIKITTVQKNMFCAHQKTDSPSLWGQHLFLHKPLPGQAQANRLVLHNDYILPGETTLILQCHCNILVAYSWDECLLRPLLYPQDWRLSHPAGKNPAPPLAQHLETWIQLETGVTSSVISYAMTVTNLLIKT